LLAKWKAELATKKVPGQYKAALAELEEVNAAIKTSNTRPFHQDYTLKSELKIVTVRKEGDEDGVGGIKVTPEGQLLSTDEAGQKWLQEKELHEPAFIVQIGKTPLNAQGRAEPRKSNNHKQRIDRPLTEFLRRHPEPKSQETYDSHEQESAEWKLRVSSNAVTGPNDFVQEEFEQRMRKITQIEHRIAQKNLNRVPSLIKQSEWAADFGELKNLKQQLKLKKAGQYDSPLEIFVAVKNKSDEIRARAGTV
jgi:hypothetical protein